MRKRLAVVLTTVLFITTLGLAAGQQTAAANNDCQQPMVYLNDEVATAQVEIMTKHRRVECAPAQAYPGPFTQHPPHPVGPYGWGHIGPVAGSAPVVDADATALAHTGSESSVLGFLGAGLVGFGAVALGVRRRIR